MTDAENSDDEHYANESFENASDTEVPEMSEFESETTENSDNDDDEDDENLSSVKVNTGPIQRNNHPANYAAANKTDVVPFDSSSEEEDEVIVGQTLVEINTASMIFEEVSATSISRSSNFHAEDKDSSEEIVEEEDEEEELKLIKEMEEKYLQQITAETKSEDLHENQQINVMESGENTEEESESSSENENGHVTETDQTQKSDNEENTTDEEYNEKKTSEETVFEKKYCEENINNVEISEASCCSESQINSSRNSIETLDQTKLMQIIQSSLTNLKISSSKNSEEKICSSSLSQETKSQAAEASYVIDPEQIALAVVNALKCTAINNNDKEKNQKPIERHSQEGEESLRNNYDSNIDKNETEIERYKDDFEEEKEVEVEKIQNKNGKDNDPNIYYDAHFDYHITSKTPTSFNSDDYIFHANFIKPLYRTNSTDKLKAKPHPRKSMSFSNERMREIERHNQILLRKILTQKPTYNLKPKSSQSSLQKLSAQANARLTTSALNRKKQQRQIDIDNQVLKRKIEAISLRRPPFIT